MTWWRIGGSSGLAASADNACPHPSHCVGMYVTIAVGSRAVRKCPGCPGWPPGLRPVGDEGGRRCHGGSDEGGLDELEELRFNCSFKALSSSLSSSSSARNLTQSWQGGLGADSSMPYSIGTRSSKIEWSERLPIPYFVSVTIGIVVTSYTGDQKSGGASWIEQACQLPYFAAFIRHALA